jgi:small subunit ribosomal protein S17e
MYLGNVRSEKVKKIARELFKRYPSRFTTDFEENKKIVEVFINTPSKRLRNTIAGYVTRLVAISETEAA